MSTTSPSTTHLTPGTWNIDRTHSSVHFSVRHLMVSKVRGSFKKFSGAVTVSESAAPASLQITIDPSSIDTGDDTRDNHLRSAEFFAVDQHPAAEYVSTAVRRTGDGYVVEGNLSLHGVTRPVELAVEFNGVGGDLQGNTRAGFTATTTINRSDFGIDFNRPLKTGGVAVGDKITITIEVAMVLAISA